MRNHRQHFKSSLGANLLGHRNLVTCLDTDSCLYFRLNCSRTGSKQFGPKGSAAKSFSILGLKNSQLL